MRKTVPIQEVEPDIDPNESIGVFNPLEDDFTVNFGGKPVTLVAGQRKILPKPIAMHIGKHLADKMVRDNLVDWLKKKFPGIDEKGRQNWRTQIQIASSKEDIEKVRDEILFTLDGVGELEIKKPVVPEPKVEKEPDVIPADVDELPGANQITEKIRERSEDTDDVETETAEPTTEVPNRANRRGARK